MSKKKNIKKRKDFTLDIYGKEFSVAYSSQVFDPTTGDECCGVCIAHEGVILINESMGEELTICTIFHELFHAYARRMGMENSGMSHELEEIIADQFGKLIAENFEFTF